MVWKLKEQLKEQLARETGYCSRPAGGRHRFALEIGRASCRERV